MLNNFTQRVSCVVSKIPFGKTLSYKEVAKLAKSQKAYRAVGSILKKNINKNLPCHRVIKSNGEIGQYNGLRGDKLELLKYEKNKK